MKANSFFFISEESLLTTVLFLGHWRETHENLPALSSFFIIIIIIIFNILVDDSF